jgi:hypothetical protein
MVKADNGSDMRAAHAPRSIAAFAGVSGRRGCAARKTPARRMPGGSNATPGKTRFDS